MLFVLNTAYVNDGRNVLRVMLSGSLEHFHSIFDAIFMLIYKAHIYHCICIHGIVFKCLSAEFETAFKPLFLLISLETESIIGQANITFIMGAVFRLKLSCPFIIFYAGVKVLHDECLSGQ